MKAILFDFWGTLVENGVRSPIKQVKEILNIRLPFPEYVVRMERAMMTSRFDELRAAFESVCDEFSADKNKVDELIGMWNKSWMLAHPYEEIEMLKELKKKYKIILISNTDNFSIEKVIEKFGMKEYFDEMFFSYDVGLIKTDKNFLKTVLDQMQLAVEDCCLVGDSMQSDIIPAKRIGIKAVLMDRRDTRNFNPKIRNLNELEKEL